MNISKSRLAIIVIITAALSYALAYFSKPAEVKEVVKYKEAKNLTTVVTKYVYKDGTVKEQTVTKDLGTISLDSEKQVKAHNLGTRLELSKLIGSESDYRLNVQSPPLLKLYKWQVGVGASVDTNKNVYGGVYVQF